MDTTVVVVGAGLAGLTAARELDRAGVDVIVLEAAGRAGGRTLVETSALGSRLDLGGQWIGHDHERVKALAAEFGATSFVMHSGVLPEIVEGGKSIRLTRPSVIVAGIAIAVVAALGRVAPRRRWTDTAVDAWLSKVPGRRARRLLEASALVSWTTDLDRLSVGGMLSMLRAQGGMKTILSTRGGAQEALLVEGIGTLTERMAADLGPRVRTGHRVTAIDQDEHGVTVRTAAGDLRAAKAIVTVPAPTASRIRHHPPLPADRAALERSTEMGTVYKAIAVFERSFWRGHGRTELVVLDNPVCAVFDTSPPDGPGHLCILASGPEARALDNLDPSIRRDTVLKALIAHYGAETAHPVGWHEKSWHLDENAGGGYIAVPSLGTTDGFWPMPSTPLGHVHWAGTETAHDHPGYLDGAIESGLRAAHEIQTEIPGGRSSHRNEDRRAASQP